MDEPNESQSVWSHPVGEVADQFGGHRIVEPFIQDALVAATVLVPLEVVGGVLVEDGQDATPV